MNLFNEVELLNIDISHLDKKKQQTDYKIKYVSEYIRLWAIISAERVDVKDINFIDCMCNAGIYMDGDCCTAMEVLNVFIEIANKHKNKNFNLYLVSKRIRAAADIYFCSSLCFFMTHLLPS